MSGTSPDPWEFWQGRRPVSAKIIRLTQNDCVDNALGRVKSAMGSSSSKSSALRSCGYASDLLIQDWASGLTLKQTEITQRPERKMIQTIQTAANLLAWGVSLLWLWKAITSAIGLRKVPDLTDAQHNLFPAGNPSLTVVVPARDEAASITTCLRSLLDQQHSNLRVLAVDDRSTDDTGILMDALALQYPDRLSVIHVTKLPSDWLGKTHAMALAARNAIRLHNPDYILFTDGDIFFRPDVLRLALAHAAVTEADHLVVVPTTLVKSSGEGMLLSYFQVMGLWAVRPWRVSDPKARRDAIGLGGFNLLRAIVYQQIGGFDAIRMEIVEDLSLGRRVKQAGFRQRVATGPGLVSIHWASGISGILNGVMKNFFAVFRYNPMIVLVSCISVFILCIAPALFLAFPLTRIPALLALASVAFLHVLSGRQSRISPWYALFFPISAALIIYSMLRSMILTLRLGGVTWRGSFYPLSELRKQAPPAPTARSQS